MTVSNFSNNSKSPVSLAVSALRVGQFVVLYDGDEREGEADLVLIARFVTPSKIEAMRKAAGGLICVAMPDSVAACLGLPFYTDMLEKTVFRGMSQVKTAYGDKPAFSISINHRSVRTGIPDNDRATTIKKFDTLLSNLPTDSIKARKIFTTSFVSPGHVFLLIGRGIAVRRGHTELSLELSRRVNLTSGMTGAGATILCEMLGRGTALSKKGAEDYAKKHGLVFLEGKELF